MARPKRLLILTMVAMLAALCAIPRQAVRAQDAGQAERKIKTQVTPVYPDLARRMNVHGKVKLQITVAPDGSVKTIHVLGGHPILAGASQDAVRNWKFEPGPKETTQMVEVNFN
jgi:TonB family protein